MRSLYNRLIILSFCALIFLPDTLLSATDQRIALVIGNGNYMDAPLRNPVNDATDIASALKELGFRVTLKTNANQRTMKESIRSFGRELQKGGVGLFYYAGHGIQYRGRNFLIPIHAEVKSAADVEYEAVDAGRVLAQMEDAGNNLNIIILDACRNNPFARSFRSAEKGLAKMDAPTGSILAYATAPERVAADGTGRNGLYTEKLLKYINSPGLELGKVFRKVRIEVLQATNKQQVPWESSSLTGDFYFAPVRGVSVTEKSTLKEVPIVASIPPIISGAQIVARDAQFRRYDNGIVYDSNTGIEWFVAPEGHMYLDGAINWSRNLNLDGGGWRLPTLMELETLYQKGRKANNLPPLLDTGFDMFWSNDKDGTAFWFREGERFDLTVSGIFKNSCGVIAARTRK